MEETTRTQTLLRRRELALGAGAELFYERPLEIVRGEGAHLFDSAGRRYIDLYNNVPCVGHGNARVAAAMAEQQRTLNVHNRYLHEGIVAFAERLCALHHDGIESAVFSCTGTEANEVAIAMARAVTGQRGIVCTDAAYHGSSGFVGSLTRVGSDDIVGREMRGFPFPDCYRPLVAGASAEDVSTAYLDSARTAIERLRGDGQGFAGLIVCPILANEGVPRIPPGFMARLTDLVHSEGGLMIADEVQSGYGRTGKWWGYEYEDFVPDIVVLGKPMGNGLPLAATAAARTMVDDFRRETGYFNTFASTPLQAAVGMAVLDEIEAHGLVQHAGELGAWLTGELQQRLHSHPRVGEVRGCGLFIGAEMVRDRESRSPDPALAGAIANRMKDAGFLLSSAGAYDNVVKIRPPLVLARGDAEDFLAEFCDCMQGIGESGTGA